MNEVKCGACGLVAYPSLNLQQNMAVAPACPSCGFMHPDVRADDMAQTPFAPKAATEKALATVTPIRTPRPEWYPPAATSPGGADVMSMIRERVQYLDLEIAKAAGYSAERKQLARMLAAAEKTK